MSKLNAGSGITLGIDLGTSAVKVLAVGPSGERIGMGEGRFATFGHLPLQAEQNPEHWLAAAGGAMQELHAAIGPRYGAEWTAGVAAIGITGQLPTLVCLSDEGPVRSAITWRDGRADAWASQLLDPARRASMYARTGMPIDGRYLAPMLQFHFGPEFDAIRTILSAKDYLLSELTGRFVTEPSTAAGYGLYDLSQQAFSPELAAFWAVPLRLLPALAPANSLAGPLSGSGAALLRLPAGIPVSTGAADSVCASYALSGLDPGVVSISLGSSAVVIGATNAMELDPMARFLVTPHVDPAWYGREMDLLASGSGYRWLSELFAWRDGELDERAAQSIPGANGLIFPPYLAGGEQGALWNPALRAGLFGLRLEHTLNDIARAYLEGVFFELRRCVDVLAERAPVDCIVVSGNIVNSPSSLQMLADILGRPVGHSLEKSPAALGAALLARRLTQPTLEPLRQPGHAGPLSSPAARSGTYRTLYRHYQAQAALCG